LIKKAFHVAVEGLFCLRQSAYPFLVGEGNERLIFQMPHPDSSRKIGFMEEGGGGVFQEIQLRKEVNLGRNRGECEFFFQFFYRFFSKKKVALNCPKLRRKEYTFTSSVEFVHYGTHDQRKYSPKKGVAKSNKSPGSFSRK